MSGDAITSDMTLTCTSINIFLECLHVFRLSADMVVIVWPVHHGAECIMVVACGTCTMIVSLAPPYDSWSRCIMYAV